MIAKTPDYYLFRLIFLVPGQNGEVRPNHWEFEASNDEHANRNATWLAGHGFDLEVVPVQLLQVEPKRVLNRYL